MKIGIYGAGKKAKIIDQNIPFIGVDGGVKSLFSYNIKPIIVIGDFDSLDDQSILSETTTISLPKMKNLTDTQEAIEYAISKGYNEIDLYGVTGHRLDHFIATFRLLHHYKDIKITVYDNDNKIYLLKKGNHRILKQGYKYLSLYTPKETVITIQGVVYPLEDYVLSYDDVLCTSNEIIDEVCTLDCNHSIYVIQSN